MLKQNKEHNYYDEKEEELLLYKQLHQLFGRETNQLGHARRWLTSSTPKRKANCRWRFWSTHCPKSKRSVSLNFSPWKLGILSWIPSNSSSARTVQSNKHLVHLYTPGKYQRTPHLDTPCRHTSARSCQELLSAATGCRLNITTCPCLLVRLYLSNYRSKSSVPWTIDGYLLSATSVFSFKEVKRSRILKIAS